jgi:hypothetical protein
MLRHYIRRSVRSLWGVGLFALVLGVWIGFLFLAYDPSRTGPARREFSLATAALYLLLLFLPGVAFICLGLALRYTLWPARHPALRSLAEHGPVAEVLAAIEAELADADRVRVLSQKPSPNLLWHLESGEVLVTVSWVIRKAELGLGLILVPLPLVVAVERQVGIPEGHIYLGPPPHPFDGALARLSDGRLIRVPTHASLSERLTLEIRARMADALGVGEKWNPTVPRRLNVGIVAAPPDHVQ